MTSWCISAPSAFNASVSLVATTSAVSEVLISSHAPGSCDPPRAGLAAAIRWSATARSARDPVPLSETPVPSCNPRTASRTVPCLSSTSRSASTPAPSARSPSCSSSGRCGQSRRRASGVRPAAAAGRRCRDLRARGMGGDRLEAGIQQRRMHAVRAVLRPDRAGQPDLGQHRVDRPVGVCAPRPVRRMPDRTECRARRTASAARCRPGGSGGPPARRPCRTAGGWSSSSAACSTAVARRICVAVLVGLHREVDGARRRHRCDGRYRGLVIEQQHRSKRTSRTSDASPKTVRAAASAISQ